MCVCVLLAHVSVYILIVMWLVIGIIEMVIFVQYAIVVKFLCIHVLSLFSPCIVYIEVYGYSAAIARQY